LTLTDETLGEISTTVTKMPFHPSKDLSQEHIMLTGSTVCFLLRCVKICIVIWRIMEKEW
jgi:hypothetical protein